MQQETVQCEAQQAYPVIHSRNENIVK